MVPSELANDVAEDQPTAWAEPTALAEERRQLEKSLTRLKGIAHLMDDRFEIPIIGTRIGLDPIIGLIPGWGDWVTWGVSAFILTEAIRLGVPIGTLLKMAGHTTVDLVTGYVPGVGDLIDVAYKANKRNVRLVLIHFGVTIDEPKADAETKPGEALDSDSDAMVRVPAEALGKPRGSALKRWAVGGVLLVALAFLAAVPFIAFYLWWQSR